MIAGTIRVSSPELIDALLDPTFLHIYLMNQAQLFENLMDENSLGWVDIHVGRIAVNRHDHIMFFGGLPDITKVFMQSTPELSCYHIIVGGKEEVVGS